MPIYKTISFLKSMAHIMLILSYWPILWFLKSFKLLLQILFSRWIPGFWWRGLKGIFFLIRLDICWKWPTYFLYLKNCELLYIDYSLKNVCNEGVSLLGGGMSYMLVFCMHWQIWLIFTNGRYWQLQTKYLPVCACKWLP